ncbi:MAG: efflux RND transporter permease subunit [Chrysiogenetes bacterium]|nr:efflux RND transporter permease subunit [Chrysiogenetes bacterium]
MVRWFLDNTAFSTVVTLMVVVLGAMAFKTLPQEEFREIKFYRVMVRAVYRGASAEEVEKLITDPIEEQLEDLEDVKDIVSSSYEGRSVVKVIFEDYLDDATYQVRIQDMRSAVQDADLPDDIEEDPFVFELKSSVLFPLISIVMSSEIGERQMTSLAEELQDRIDAIPGVDRTFVSGIRDREVWVWADPDRLASFGLSLDQVAGAIRNSNLDLPAGTLKVGRSEILVRTEGEVDRAEELEDIVVSGSEGGRVVRVRDVAMVLDTFEPLKGYSRADGEPSMNIAIYKSADSNSIGVIDEVKAVTADFSDQIPPTVNVELVGDRTERIRNRLQVLRDNILLGFFALLVILYFFIGMRNALVVAVGVPVSLLICFFAMHQYGESLNSQSLFAIVLVLGMLVDDALVVTENIHRHVHMGKRVGQAALDGTNEVLWPVISSSMTTIAAFLPMALLDGVIGQFMRIVPIVVTVALLASLAECFLLLPGHVKDFAGEEEEGHPRVTTWFERVTVRYSHALRWVLERRVRVVAATFVGVLLTTVLMAAVKKNLWENDDFSMFSVRVWAPEGTRLEETDKLIREVERRALELPENEVAAVLADAGTLRTETEFLFKSNVGQVTVELNQDSDARRSAEEIIDDLKSRVGDVPGIETIVYAKRRNGPPAGAPVEVYAQWDYLDELDEISAKIMAAMEGLTGTRDVQRDLEVGKQEVVIDLDQKVASQYGLNTRMVARHIRTAIYGEIAGFLRDGNDEIDIVVKTEGGDEMGIDQLKDLRIPTPGGGFVPLSNIARVKVKPVIATINHFDLKRTVGVTADIDQTQTTTQKANEEVMAYSKELAREYPGLRFRYEGEFAALQKALRNIGGLFLLGVFIMYAILVAQFRSLMVPWVVMFTVPMAAVGVLAILFISNISFSITTIFGVVALAGVVVNDSIVLVDFIIERRKFGDTVEERNESIIEAGTIRLRPIFLTTVTTLVGLLPMALGLGGKSVTWGNMAKTVSAGLGCASLMAVFIIPALYAIVDDVVRRFQGGKSTVAARFLQDEEPAGLEEASEEPRGQVVPIPKTGG